MNFPPELEHIAERQGASIRFLRRHFFFDENRFVIYHPGMIDYDPKRWFWMVFSYRGTVLPGVLQRLMLFSLWTVAIILLNLYYPGVINLDPVGHTLMGAMVGFLIVLRTNTAYERFWEARKLWGGVVNSSRNLIREAVAFTPPARELAELNAAYVLALKQLLRGSRDLGELRPWLTEPVRTKLESTENPPLMLTCEMARWIKHRVDEGKLDPILAQHIDDRVRELIDYQGGCERILRTPIPFNYAVHIKQFLSIYLLTLPLVLVPRMGFMSIPVVLLIAFGLGGIEEAGVEVEDPFGTDPNDLPLERFCSTISRDVNRLVSTYEPPTQEKVS